MLNQEDVSVFLVLFHPCLCHLYLSVPFCKSILPLIWAAISDPFLMLYESRFEGSAFPPGVLPHVLSLCPIYPHLDPPHPQICIPDSSSYSYLERCFSPVACTPCFLILVTLAHRDCPRLSTPSLVLDDFHCLRNLPNSVTPLPASPKSLSRNLGQAPPAVPVLPRRPRNFPPLISTQFCICARVKHTLDLPEPPPSPGSIPSSRYEPL